MGAEKETETERFSRAAKADKSLHMQGSLARTFCRA